MKSIASYAPPVAIRCPVMGKVSATANCRMNPVTRALKMQFLSPPCIGIYTYQGALKEVYLDPGHHHG